MNQHQDYELGESNWIMGYELKAFCNNSTSD